MDIIIPDKWLKEYLSTKATPKEIAKYLSLCGPSVERIKGEGESLIYEIEVTTNRIDSASVIGIAREASAILPRFGISANFTDKKVTSKINFKKSVNYLKARLDSSLCQRACFLLIKDVNIKASPAWLTKRLELVGERGINNAVDSTNYLMYELGQPIHIFDYDKIKGSSIVLRKSKPGEKVKTLDGQEHPLPKESIAIEDKGKRIIDLAGIMGGELAKVNKDTKNILLFVQTYNPVNIRRTSMSIPKRTAAAKLFEKGLDPEGVSETLLKAQSLISELTQGKPEGQALDIYPKKQQTKTISLKKEFIDKKIGISLSKKEISQYLTSLYFKPTWTGETLTVKVPSFRARDIEIKEDVLEEIARIYGYQNIPSILMSGGLPQKIESTLKFEQKIKQILSSLTASEVYTLSLVEKNFIKDSKALKIKNPLGKEGEYLRTSLTPSLVKAADENTHEKDSFILFEIANIYTPQTNDLPEESLNLCIVFAHQTLRDAVSIVNSLFDQLHIEKGEAALEKNKGYYTFEMPISKLVKLSKPYEVYKEAPKYPPQVEDITFTLDKNSNAAKIHEAIKKSHKNISEIELTTIYKNAYTWRINYQSETKTLTDREVKTIRDRIIKEAKKLNATYKG